MLEEMVLKLHRMQQMRLWKYGKYGGGVLMLVLLFSLSWAGIAEGAPYPWDYDLTTDLVALDTNHSPAPAVVDWNADGRDDLLVGFRSADQHGGIGIYLRNEDGTLATDPSSVFTDGDASSVIGWTLYFRPVMADWNGDGKKDLLYGQYYGHKGVVFCSNEGTDSEPIFRGDNCSQLHTSSGSLVGLTTGSNVAYVSPEVVDWDNDGDLDLLVGTGATANEKGVRLYTNTGSVTSPALDEPTNVVSKEATSGLAFENYYEPDVVDFNDDGNKDLLIGGSRRGNEQEFVLRICLNSGSDSAPAFASCSHQFLPGLVNNAIDFHDWDGDGYLDLLRGFHSGFITNPVTLFHGEAPDTDGDGLSDSIDNCPATPNPADLMLDRTNPVQTDTDGDGQGDACDPDDDGDTVEDTLDNCAYTPNSDQADVDGDGNGDVCDPEDDREGEPGAGSYEAQMADKMAWGRKPVIIMRADAMSVGYRQEIAEALTNAALERDMEYTLAVIPWNQERFAGTEGADFLTEKRNNPNFEAVQHGTYHVCVYTASDKAGSAEEFNCGMDESQSFNLMRVGFRSMAGYITPDEASHQLTGFVPPADAFDAAAVDAIRALGYRYIASAYYREQNVNPDLFYTDEHGLVHVPWTQIACGNGAASWTDCQTTDINAHSGVDCGNRDICMPTADGKDYSNWEQYANNRLAERCRNDFQRYGLCSILFELTSYDKDFSLGALDETAFEGYKATLDELLTLAEEEDAVFMTLGEYAAAQLIDDTTAPTIAIHTPSETSYGHHELVTVDVQTEDDLSGIWSVAITLDGTEIQNGDTIDLLDLSLGEHTLTVEAEDTAGNQSTASMTFDVVSSVESLRATVQRFLDEGGIQNAGVATSLLQTLDAASASLDRGNVNAALNQLNAFENEIEGQRGKQIQAEAADLLLSDLAYVKAQLEASNSDSQGAPAGRTTRQGGPTQTFLPSVSSN